MTIVVDTTVLIDHLRGDARAHELLRGAEDERLTATVLTKIEVTAGVRPGEEPQTRRLLSVVEWIPVDDSIAERAGDLAAGFLRSHPGVEVVDYVVAATVEELDAELWTGNVKHFPMYPGLRPPY